MANSIYSDFIMNKLGKLDGQKGCDGGGQSKSFDSLTNMTTPCGSDIQISTRDQHGDFKSKERESVSTLDSSCGRSLMIHQASILTVQGASLQFWRIPLISGIIQELYSKPFQK
jgi:hypothetical protein